MNDRYQRILASLVQEYIEQGEPVSSAWLAEHSPLGLSSATVRNILVRLEELGLVRQPHTSAGRIPTDSGYRLYVDSLLGARREQKAPTDLEFRLRQSGTVDDLLEQASAELSRASHQIGFALTAANPNARLKHIDFAVLDERRVLVIVVSAGGHVTHRVVEADEECSAAMLSQAANYINAEFAGLTLQEVREAIVERMREERMLYDALMTRALQLAQTGLEHANANESLHVQGASFLIDGFAGDAFDRERTLDTLRVLFKMIEEKHHLVELLTRSIETTGVTVVIGSEHGSPDLRLFSLVASSFQDGGRSGTVGVIGPTRMRYQRAITIVDGVSRAVTRLLEGQ
jgi:heat-inducible transcriptional repressor